jgi:hypothetical protein
MLSSFTGHTSSVSASVMLVNFSSHYLIIIHYQKKPLIIPLKFQFPKESCRHVMCACIVYASVYASEKYELIKALKYVILSVYS